MKCLKCGDIIEGDKKGTYIQCSCKAIAIDQTEWYCRMIGDEKNWVEIKTIKNEIVEKHSQPRETMKFVSKTSIEIERELSDLDRFALDFMKILHKHTPYVIVSGYVSILLGRARVSEDIDVIIPKISFSAFKSLIEDLKKNKFYCLNAEKEQDIFEYLTEDLAIRFAKQGTVIPNIEIKWIKNKFDTLALKKTITVTLHKGKLIISHLELQIAFKEAVLKSPKDREDARHLRKIGDGHLDDALIEQYKEQLHEFFYKKK